MRKFKHKVFAMGCGLLAWETAAFGSRQHLLVRVLAWLVFWAFIHFYKENENAS